MYIGIFSLFIGQVGIIVLLFVFKQAIQNSRNKTAQVQELLAEVETKRKEAKFNRYSN